MSRIFHVTVTQGRADTFYIEADTKGDVLSFLGSITEATITNIKEVVFSKDLNINYIPQTQEYETAFRVVHVMAFSDSYAENFELFNVKHTATKDSIIAHMKNMFILDEPIIDVADITFYD